MASLLRFTCEWRALETLADGGELGIGSAFLEPLVLRGAISLALDALTLSFAVAVPNLTPYGMLKFVGETGVLDRENNLWHARAVDRILRSPTSAVEKLGLGARRDLAKFVDPNGLLHVGVLVSDLTLLPDRHDSGLKPIHSAHRAPDFIVRRLKTENFHLQYQLRELEANFHNVLSAVCPDGESGPAPAPDPAPAPKDAAAPKDAVAAAPEGSADSREIARIAGVVLARENPAELEALIALLGRLTEAARDRLAEAGSCAVCCDRPADTRFRPCGHACCCAPCAAALPAPPLCPLCRAAIARAEKALAQAPGAPAAPP